jgi:hypothetical protein
MALSRLRDDSLVLFCSFPGDLDSPPRQQYGEHELVSGDRNAAALILAVQGAAPVRLGYGTPNGNAAT